MNLAERALATEAVLKKFDRPFDWAGSNCIRLARAQAVALGHDLPPVPLFRTALGARRALSKRGFASVTDLLDAHFERLRAPAFMWVGDICVGPADPDHGLEAVGISDGQGNVWGWHESNGHARPVAILQANAAMTAAWRL